MDEVDKIIIHSLKQIGCKIKLNSNDVVDLTEATNVGNIADGFTTAETDDDGNVVSNKSHNLQGITPSLLVQWVSKCLMEINSNIVVPESLPENMAQRFSVASTLAEMCISCGYRADIGYQTFLYPNVVDVRRLLMFLIEQLPQEPDNILSQYKNDERTDFDRTMNEIKKTIYTELHTPWVPSYSRCLSLKTPQGYSMLNVPFQPYINFKVFTFEDSTNHKASKYEIDSSFQQISDKGCNLISTFLHKNALDLYENDECVNITKKLDKNDKGNVIFNRQVHISANDESILEKEMVNTSSPLNTITEAVEALKLNNDEILKKHTHVNTEIEYLHQQLNSLHQTNKQLAKDLKIHERTCVITEDAQENLIKLEGLINKSKERRIALEEQWQLHRKTALERIQTLEHEHRTANGLSLQEVRQRIEKFETLLVERTKLHDQLRHELENMSNEAIPRNDYTERIYEFIGNINKQRNDIEKILSDTHELQKELNVLSEQLDRQFNYTDDLLYQSAKQDAHAKRAYKLFATLHAACNAIYDLVSETGQITKEIRDLEEEIDRERNKNVAASLQQITADIENFQKVIRNLEAEIHGMECK